MVAGELSDDGTMGCLGLGTEGSLGSCGLYMSMDMSRLQGKGLQRCALLLLSCIGRMDHGVWIERLRHPGVYR